MPGLKKYFGGDRIIWVVIFVLSIYIAAYQANIYCPIRTETMTNIDQQIIYAERANNRYECWTYCDRERYQLRSFHHREDIQRYASRNQFRVVFC